MAAKVSLDALIPREDFEIEDTVTSKVRNTTALTLSDLKWDSLTFPAFRKPDFQRETNEWSPEKICDLIESFLEGDLIPAIILWRSPGSYIFVIDGSHRLSSLAAWVNNDYGDGAASKAFYDGIIPDEQLEIAEATRTLIRKRIGPFQDYEMALRNPDKVSPIVFERAKSLGVLALQLQWVEGEASKAEASFFKINQLATPLDATELKILQSRKNPDSIAARAIIRSGKGHKYWSRFSDETQSKIQGLAQEIYQLLFIPKLATPIKTLDVPVGGKLASSQTLALILDFINISNQTFGIPQKVDTDGSQTITMLTKAKKVAERINSLHPGSLGLHPIIYFYSQYGQYKIATFMAVTSLVIEFEKKNMYQKFIDVRQNFEELLLKADYLIQQIVRKYRFANKAYEHIRDFYLLSIEKLAEKKDLETVINEVVSHPKFNYLRREIEIPNSEVSGDFSRDTKSAAFLREAIPTIMKCPICGGYLHTKSITIDHVNRKQDGGSRGVENAQLAHPICNSTIKN
jgi:hypothetical protein